MPRLVRQALLCCDREDAIAVIDSALNTGALMRTRLVDVLGTLPPQFATVADQVDARSESGLETLCRLRLARLGVAIRSQVRIAGVGRVDLLIGDRIVLEADGESWHTGPTAFAADRSRDLALTRQGYAVIRVSYRHVVREWQLIELAVSGLIARGEHRWSAAHRRAGVGR